MRKLTLLSLLSAAGLSVGLAAREPSDLLRLDFWNAPTYEQQVEKNRLRQQDLEVRLQMGILRIEHKAEVTRSLLLRRQRCPEAVAAFCHINRAYADPTRGGPAAGSAEEVDLACRQLVLWAREMAYSEYQASAAEMVDRCDREMDAVRLSGAAHVLCAPAPERR